jgi:hypothetical protein
MPGLPFFDDNAPQPIRTPAIEITMGDGGSSGGFGGMVDAATSLLGGPSAPSWPDYLVSFSLQQGFAPQVDTVDLLVADTEDAPGAALGDRGSVSMGAAGALETIFSGTVIAVEQRGDGMRRYQLANGSHTLAQARINQSVTEMTIQDAIEFAVGEFDFSATARVSAADETLPQIIFDDSASIWDHITYLASVRGINLWFDADDQLQMADQLEQGDSVATFTWGQDLLEANLWQRSPHRGAVTAFGGDRVDGDFTLRKQAPPNRAQLGDGSPQRFYRDGLLQSPQDLSTRAGAATLFGQRQTTAGEIVVSGSAALSPGRVIELAGLSGDSDGRYLINRNHQRLDHLDGWRTRLWISKADASPGGLDLLGGLF